MVVALKPLHDLASIKRIIVSTYQASSGKGAKGVTELDAQLQAIGRGEPIPPVTAHAAQLAGNVVTLDWKLGEDGYTEEEIKMIRETQKIMGDETILVSPTCARVPVRTGHSESINVEFHRPITVHQAREALPRARESSCSTIPRPVMHQARFTQPVRTIIRRKDTQGPLSAQLP